jgi:hypothetical protein
VPEISRFLGIVITMFYRDHGPPHFHATYGGYDIVVSISDGVVTGQFPRRALRLVLEWYELHKTELVENWELARQRKPLKRIAPLE